MKIKEQVVSCHTSPVFVKWLISCKYQCNIEIIMAATPDKKDSRFNADIILVGEKTVPESVKKLLELVAQKNRKNMRNT